ncbi:MAG TPA: thioredoxin domain-containing protein [Candidatus Acidoferrales bacterium]|nr:thioredoxin domain-containing protein [Candidatus Acidoferrales bacterium]
MHRFPRNTRRFAGFCLFGALALFAQDWQTMTTLPAVDMNGLTPARQTTALKALRSQDCACGCGMKVAECRVKDPGCSVSRGLATVIVDAIKKGKTEAGALAEAKASKFAQPPETKLLEDAVNIPTANSPVTGPASAPITLVEFSDFQCPFCYKAVAQLNTVLKAYPTHVKLVFKQFPLVDSHPEAAISAAAALAANQQGKFWQMHDVMFANHGGLSRKAIMEWAAGLGLDMKRFTADLDSPGIKQAVMRDMDDGNKAGVDATPTLFIDGQKYNGALALDALKPVIEAELKRLAAKPAAKGKG